MRIGFWMMSVSLVIALALGQAASAHAQPVEAHVTVTVPPPPANAGALTAPPPYQQTYAQPHYGQPPYVQPQYVQPQYAQPHYQLQPQRSDRTRSLRPLWISGAIVLPVSYVLTAVTATATTACATAYGPCRDVDYTLFSWVPLIGPWFMLGQDDTRPLNAGEILGAVAGGLAQLAGLTMIIVGASIREPVDDGDSRASNALEPELRLGLAPALGGGQLIATLTHF